MKYLTEFNTLDGYKADLSSDFIESPNVSFVADKDTFFDPTIDYTIESVECPTDTLPATSTTADINVNVTKNCLLTNGEKFLAYENKNHIQKVSFDKNTLEEEVTKEGNFNLFEHSVNWSIKQKAKLPVDFIDLGITNSNGQKILWANCNIGATKPEEYGLYFQWGATVGYSDGSHSTWITAPCNGSSSSYSSTSWRIHSGECVSSSCVLLSSSDAATIAYGSEYRMPTYVELSLLTANTTYSYDTVNGVKGGRFTSKKDTTKSIFIPFAGFYTNSSISLKGEQGIILSNCIYQRTNPTSSYGMYFNSSARGLDGRQRCYSFTIRAVQIVD